MSLHPDTLITVPHGYEPLNRLTKHSIVYNLASKEHIIIEDIIPEERELAMSIHVPGLKPLICSTDQMISTTDGFMLAQDLCTACKIITGIGARAPIRIDYIPVPHTLLKVIINSSTPTFLANGIYVVAERSKQ